ncbi:MAG: SocA family protein [Bacilli bacterium]|nr:SocA family protein [Bacilli bacterium]
MLKRVNVFNAIDIANWFLWKNKIEQIENITEYDEYEVYEGLTHLKLQKLIYFAQGLFLAYTKKPLFNEKVMAWEHGPVVKEVYNNFSRFKRNEITIDLNKKELDIIDKLEAEEKISTVLNFVYENFGKYTAWQLREMTHIKGGPWEKIVSEKGLNNEIPQKLMGLYFNKYVEEEK